MNERENTMNLQITGLHMEVGENLRNHCQTAVEAVSHFFPEMVDVRIQCQSEGHRHLAEIKIHASQIHLRAHGEGEDFYLAVDHAMSKLVRQLDKYKGRLQKHRSRRENEKFALLEEVTATHNRLQEAELESAPEAGAYAPNVTHKVVKTIQTLSVDEAVMQMDLMHTNVFIFNNSHTSQLNVVYREEDGNIGWVEIDKVEKVAKSA